MHCYVILTLSGRGGKRLAWGLLSWRRRKGLWAWAREEKENAGWSFLLTSLFRSRSRDRNAFCLDSFLSLLAIWWVCLTCFQTLPHYYFVWPPTNLLFKGEEHSPLFPTFSSLFWNKKVVTQNGPWILKSKVENSQWFDICWAFCSSDITNCIIRGQDREKERQLTMHPNCLSFFSLSYDYPSRHSQSSLGNRYLFLNALAAHAQASA